jgi:hypothetical protein
MVPHVQSQLASCGIYGERSGTGAGFSLILQVLHHFSIFGRYKVKITARTRAILTALVDFLSHSRQMQRQYLHYATLSYQILSSSLHLSHLVTQRHVCGYWHCGRVLHQHPPAMDLTRYLAHHRIRKFTFVLTSWVHVSHFLSQRSLLPELKDGSAELWVIYFRHKR